MVHLQSFMWATLRKFCYSDIFQINSCCRYLMENPLPAIASFIAFRSLLGFFGQCLCVLSRLLFSQKHHGSHHQKQFGCYLVLLVRWLRAWVCHLYILQSMCKPECIEPLVHADNHAAFARVYCSCCASHPLCLEYRFSLTGLAILPMVYTLLHSPSIAVLSVHLPTVPS